MMICPGCFNSKYKFLLSYNNNLILYKPEDILAPKVEPPKLEDLGSLELGKRKRADEEKCCIAERVEQLKDIIDTPVFLKDTWQNILCFCDECQTLYKENGVYDIVTSSEEEEEQQEEKNPPPEHSVLSFNFTKILDRRDHLHTSK